MPHVYSIAPVTFTPGTFPETVLQFMCAAEKQVKVRRLELTSDNTAGSTVIDVLLTRIQAEGTATTIVAQPLNQNHPAAGFTAKFNSSAEPTTDSLPTGVLYRFKWNVQVPYTLVLGPGEEFIIPGATNEGFAVELLEDPSTAITVTLIVEED